MYLHDVNLGPQPLVLKINTRNCYLCQKKSKALRMKWLWRFRNENQAYWKEVISAKYEGEDYWMTKTVTTPYGVSVWRSIRYLWHEFKKKYKDQSGKWERTNLWMDVWHEAGRLENLFPDTSTLVSHQHKSIAGHWSPQGWNFIFRGRLNDREIQIDADSYNTIGPLNRLEGG